MSQPIHDQDRTALVAHLDFAEHHWTELIAAMDAGRPFDDGSGHLQDPGTAIQQSVLEVVQLRLVRLVLSTGGPSVTAEATVERDGRLSNHRLVADTLSDHIERPINESSALARVLRSYAIELGE